MLLLELELALVLDVLVTLMKYDLEAMNIPEKESIILSSTDETGA